MQQHLEFGFLMPIYNGVSVLHLHTRWTLKTTMDEDFYGDIEEAEVPPSGPVISEQILAFLRNFLRIETL